MAGEVKTIYNTDTEELKNMGNNAVAASQLDDTLQPYNYTFNTRFVKGTKKVWAEYDDPTYLGFTFLFNFNEVAKYGYPISPLLNTDNDKHNAYNYLLSINEPKRAKLLKKFVDVLLNINKMTPWYWQELQGLENIWKFKNFSDPYLGGDDAVLKINTLENIGLYITQLMYLYKTAVYDLQYRRVLLPENLRKFEMVIFIQDLRYLVIRDMISNTQPDANIINKSSYLFIILQGCEFINDESSLFLENLSMGGIKDPSKQQIHIKYENVQMIGGYFFNLEDTVLGTKIYNNNLENFILGDKTSSLKRKDISLFGELGQSVYNDTRNRYEQQIDKYKNLYDDYPSKIIKNTTAQTTNFLYSKIYNALLGNVYDIKNTVSKTLLSANIYSMGPNRINSIINENIYKK